MTVFSLWDPDDPMLAVDLFVVEPVPFHDLFARSETIDLGGVRARVASIDDLIAMKRIAGRPVDLEDVDALRAIREESSDG
jgi:predicted nucleotidyltransferase